MSPRALQTSLVTPQQAIFKSSDGLELHGQLFVPAGARPGDKYPALIFLHGGPIRQMLLGWHYVLLLELLRNESVPRQPRLPGSCSQLPQRDWIRPRVSRGAETRRSWGFRISGRRRGGRFLQGRPDVDPKRIGLWGGSYGGYLTALGLGRNSDLFAAGVDLHGVHDWPTDNGDGKNIPAELTKLAHDSSPVTAVNTEIPGAFHSRRRRPQRLFHANR